MRWVGTEIDDSDFPGDVSDSIHVDVCPECGMPFHGHGLQMRDELDADSDGPYACTGADYHDPNCGGTCGAG